MSNPIQERVPAPEIRRAALQAVCLLALSILLAVGPAWAIDPVMTEPVVLSGLPDTGVDGEAAAKSKLARLTYSTSQGFAKPLIAVYADGAGPLVWSFDESIHAAADIFVSRSLDDGATWSTPLNLAKAANLSSISVDHDGDSATPPVAYAGDAEKPNLVASGKRILITWVSRYCPSGLQRTVRYAEAGNIEVPYGCLWSARSSDGGAHWSPAQRMTDGFRDAKQDVPRGTSSGFVVTLQQDPRGLQPGDAEGPGDGGSGAKVSKGTDIWWTALATAGFDSGAAFPAVQRLTDNFTGLDEQGYESGMTGASRANLLLKGGLALVAYEETKGSDVLAGKLVRYHAFSAFDSTLPDATAGAGCIVSQLDENGRRVRIVQQPDAFLGASALRWLIFWRQGLDGEGGAGDIVARLGSVQPGDPDSTGFRPADLFPAVAADCADPAFAASNAPPLNLSSSAGVSSSTADDSAENARAHRAVVRGDTIVMGWTWTPKWTLADSIEAMHYDFFVRSSFDGGATWGEVRNLSNLAGSGLTVNEPRLVSTPSSPDPADLPDPNVLFAAWSIEPNSPVTSPAMPLDIELTRSTDMGITWEPRATLAGGPEGQMEAQMTPDPQGERLFGVWQERDASTLGVDTMFRSVTYFGLFADGFDSGDSSRWSQTVP